MTDIKRLDNKLNELKKYLNDESIDPTYFILVKLSEIMVDIEDIKKELKMCKRII